MQLESFVRKPFVVQAIEITDENIAEMAKFIGTLKVKGDGTKYIQVNANKVPNIPRVYIGYWMTRMGKNTRCYSSGIFKREFTRSNATLLKLVEAIDG